MSIRNSWRSNLARGDDDQVLLLQDALGQPVVELLKPGQHHGGGADNKQRPLCPIAGGDADGLAQRIK